MFYNDPYPHVRLCIPSPQCLCVRDWQPGAVEYHLHGSLRWCVHLSWWAYQQHHSSPPCRPSAKGWSHGHPWNTKHKIHFKKKDHKYIYNFQEFKNNNWPDLFVSTLCPIGQIFENLNFPLILLFFSGHFLCHCNLLYKVKCIFIIWRVTKPLLTVM